MTIELEGMDSQQLDALIAAAGEKKRQLQRERISEVRRKLTAIARDEGFTIEELFGSAGGGGRSHSAKGRSVPAKYRNPADPTQTWSGRGKRPRWFLDALEQGKSENDLLIG